MAHNQMDHVRLISQKEDSRDAKTRLLDALDASANGEMRAKPRKPVHRRTMKENHTEADRIWRQFSTRTGIPAPP